MRSIRRVDAWLVRWSMLAPVVFLVLQAAACGRPSEQAVEVSKRVTALIASEPSLSLRDGAATVWQTEQGQLRAPEGGLAVQLPPVASKAWQVGTGWSEAELIQLSPVGASPVSFEQNGKHAIYRETYHATDAVYSGGSDFVELYYLLRSAEAPSHFSWGVTLPPGIVSAQPREGGLEFLATNGEPVLRIPEPFAVDAAGVRRSASLQWSAPVLSISIDTEGLQYPVLLDPVVETVTWTRLTPSPPDFQFGSFAKLGDHALMWGAQSWAANSATNTRYLWEWDGTAWTEINQPALLPVTSMKLVGFKQSTRVAAIGNKNVYNYNTILKQWDIVLSNNANLVTDNYNTLCVSVVDVGVEKALCANTVGNAFLWTGSTVALVAGPKPVGYYPAMTSVGNDAVMFVGGRTWYWRSGAGWTDLTDGLKATGAYPPMDGGGTMGELNGEAILFGGNLVLAPQAQTWALSLSPSPAWRRLQPLHSPPPTSYPTGSLPTINNKVIYPSNGRWIWTFDGVDWAATPLDKAPPARTRPAVGALPPNAVVFGGQSIGDCTSDQNGQLWTGSDWSPNAAVGVLQRTYAASATLNDVTYLFGGTGAASADDAKALWKWDGLSWQKVVLPPAAPQPASGVYRLGMASFVGADGQRKIVMVGGKSTTDYGFNTNTWIWDGSAWALGATGALAAQTTSSMVMATVFDPALNRDVAILFGGYDQLGTRNFDQTWKWDGATWTNISVSLRALSPEYPPALEGGSAVTLGAGATSRMLMMGGINDFTNFKNTDTWTLSLASGWHRVQAGSAVTPPSMLQPPLVAIGPDSAVLVAPSTSGARDGVTWLWNGTRWTRPDIAHPWEGSTGLAVTSGGQAFISRSSFCPVEPALDDTWVRSDTAWIQMTPTTRPPPRFGASLGQAGKGLLLFGGMTQSELYGTVLVGDTWLWDGTNWSEQHPTRSPEGRTLFSMAGIGSRTLLFGGASSSASNAQIFGDTWEWSGSTWVKKTPRLAPPARKRHAMVSFHDHVLLFGGESLDPNLSSVFWNDLWSWDGESWTQLTPSGPKPRARRDPQLMALGSKVVLQGGADAAGAVTDVWEWNGTAWNQISSAVVTNGQSMFLPALHDFPLVATQNVGHGIYAANTYGILSPNDGYEEYWQYKRSLSQGGLCQTDSECGTGHCTNGVCCSVAACPAMQYCEPDTGVGTKGNCAALVGPGAPCKLDVACVSGACSPSTGLCKPTCAIDTDCSASSFCNHTVVPAHCDPKLDDGVDCANNGDCVNGLCAGSPKTCAPWCTINSDCPNDRYCVSGWCWPRRQDGEGCFNDDACLTNACVDSANPLIGVCRCGQDAQCSGASFCDLDTATGCLPSLDDGPCRRDAQCPDAQHCDLSLGGKCVADLPDESPCDRGEVCLSGTCVAGTCGGACASDRDCASIFHCELSSHACTLDPTSPGGDCARDAECAANQYCSAVSHTCVPDENNGDLCDRGEQCIGGACLDGHCGARCESDTQCPDDEYCDNGGRCRPNKLTPDACQRGEQCAIGGCMDGICGPDCRTDIQCAAVYFCDTTTHKCLPDLPPSASCDRDAQCLESAYCDVATHTCQPDMTDGQGVCNRGEQCLSGGCVDGVCGHTCAQDSQCEAAMYCSSLGTCAPDIVPDGGCTKDSMCIGSAHCDLTLKKCQPDKPDPEKCSRGEECSSGACVAGTCGPTCFKDDQCALVASCINGSCAPDVPADEPCTRDEQCAAGTYCDGATGRCKSTLSDDQFCDRGEMCLHGACSGGHCGNTCIYDSDCPKTGYCESGICMPDNPPGGNCFDNTECDGDAHCNQTLGKCVVDFDIGEDCTEGEECANSACVAGKCNPFCAQDAQCQRTDFCDLGTNRCMPRYVNGSTACERDQQCAETGHCALQPEGSHRCVVDLPGGSTCDRGEECVFQTSGACNHGVCQALCASDNDCSTNAYCDRATQRCLPDEFPGHPCDRDALCIEQGFCNFATGRCESERPDGGVCDRGEVCGHAACILGQCAPMKIPGGNCTRDAQCPLDLYCSLATHQCFPDKEIGESCARDAMCQDWNFCGSDGKCAFDRPVPEPCSRGEQCLGTAACVSGACSDTCSNNLECPVNRYCGPSGQCIPDELPDSPCATDEQCTLLGYCGDDGICDGDHSDDGACTRNAMCDSERCEKGLCIRVCSPGTRDGGDGQCVSVDCATGYQYRDGRCQKLCPEDRLDDGTGSCLSTPCAPGTVLAGNGRCELICPPGEHDDGAGHCVDVNLCATGYRLEGGGCALDCPFGQRDDGLGACAIACAANYHLSNGLCRLTCPTGQVDNGSGSCVSSNCAPGKILVNGRCTLACADGKFDNGLGVCADVCSEGTLPLQGICAKACPLGQLDDGTGVCVDAPCSPGYQSQRGGCYLICPGGEHDGGDAHACLPIPSCLQGYRNGGDGVCVPVGPCAGGYVDHGDGRCILDCAAGQMDSGLGSCVPSSCASGYTMTALGCVKSCPSGQLDDGTGTCAARCAPGQRLQGTLCARDCPSGQHDDGAGACVDTGACSSGYVDRGDGLACVLECPEGRHDNGLAICVARPLCAATYRDDGLGRCVLAPLCAVGFIDHGRGCELACVAGSHNGGNGTCVPEPSCVDGYRSGGDGVCVPVGPCAAGSIDHGDGRCILDCPTGQIDDGLGNCTEAQCADGFERVDSRCTRQCPPDADGNARHDAGDGSCTLSGCSAGFTPRAGECARDCPPETHDEGSGRCVATGNCAVGYIDLGDDLCRLLCPDGQHDDGAGLCVAKPLCAVGSHDDGAGHCVAPPTCLLRYAVDEFGICRLVCLDGQHDTGLGLCGSQAICDPGFHDGGLGNCTPNATCETGFTLHHGTCVIDCPTGEHDGGDRTCVPASVCVDGYRNGGDGVCIPVGPCAGGYVDHGNGVCVLVCPAGQIDDGVGVCRGGQCAPLYELLEGRCVLTCPEPNQHDDGTGQCIEVPKCATDLRLQGGRCILDCPDGQHDDGVGQCIAVGPCSGGYVDHGDSECGKACPVGQRNDGLGVCADLCAPGFHDGGRGYCLADPPDLCADGYRWGTVGGVTGCHLLCPSGERENGVGVCAEPCAEGWSEVEGVCRLTCPGGQHDDGTGHCAAICGEHYTAQGGRCVLDCPPGEVDNGEGICAAPGTPTCEDGYRLDPRGRCERICPKGQHDRGHGVCGTGCDEGFHDDGTGVCAEVPTCAPGYVATGTDLICERVCPPGMRPNDQNLCVTDSFRPHSIFTGGGGCSTGGTAVEWCALLLIAMATRALGRRKSRTLVGVVSGLVLLIGAASARGQVRVEGTDKFQVQRSETPLGAQRLL